ncbi:MotA/TolQ/ExbB proton channel family protein [Sphingobacterium gobiense]|uniref:Flagellar motor protein MotA n=1 Tax=Sphingobacterium gobiense TaxID=1382456 RepID=A0A2S9JV39_9SPHI|nr:MotA/TolQ/ExbB proton channel family protein [Sphingobacterium gobiense]PRD57001.1 flagellar motor protein MotA [Sphingobacterium gobiense]
MIELIENLLFQIGSLLHLPVFLGLLLMVFWVLWSLGAFVREVVFRRKKKRVLLFLQKYEAEIETLLTNEREADINLTELVQLWEKAENAKLDRIRFLVKVAPSLGLVGTLIPMGQSLSTLSTGDMSAMASHMVTAFTATIIGLVCGILAYLISLKREQWLSRDFLTCEAIIERKLRTEAGKPSVKKVHAMDNNVII